jgi:hypothetical protein
MVTRETRGSEPNEQINPEGLNLLPGCVYSCLLAAGNQRRPYSTLSGLSFCGAVIRGLVRRLRQTNPRLNNGTALGS